MNLSIEPARASFHAENVQRVAALHWEDLGLPEAVWELAVAEIGALIVAIDSTGATLYKNIMDEAASRMPGCYARLHVQDADRRMIHWPPTLSGTRDVPDGMITVGGGA